MFVQNNKCDKSFVAKDNKIKVSVYNLDVCDVDFLLRMGMLVGTSLENKRGVFIYQNIYNYYSNMNNPDNFPVIRTTLHPSMPLNLQTAI